MEFSTGGWLDILAVTVPAALGAGGTISVAITKFFERHQGKKVVFGPEGQLETMEGYSLKHVEQVLDRVAQQKRENDQSWEATLRQLRAEPDAGSQPPAPPEIPGPESAP